MEAGRTRYEVRVGTLVSAAAIATFRVAVKPIAVRRKTVYRLRLPADRDLSEIVHRLTEHDVEVLEIRRCPEGSVPGRPAPVPPEACEQGVPAPAECVDAVVLPFRGRAWRRRDGSAG